jgi:GDPmannose 4,6-dehydratase
MFGKIYGRFFLGQYLGLTHDDEVGVATLSELIETYDHWETFVTDARKTYDKVQLFTMFETDDVHPHIINCMKHFDKVIVPFDYLKEILERHDIPCESLNYWSSDLIRSKPNVIEKKRDPNRLVFLYNGTNDVRKNVTTLTRVFAKACEGTEHTLIVKTNKGDGLTQSKNIKIITEHLSNEKLSSLFNLCDYCITCTRGEGVSLLHLEGAYFGKPIISHDGGVFRDLGVHIIPLPWKKVPVDLTDVPPFLHKVFYGKWWEIDEEGLMCVIQKCITKEKIAVITGASGQDGYYLQKLLEEKEYPVKCIGREENVNEVISQLKEYERIEIYNLAAQSHVGKSFECATETFETNTKIILDILEAVRTLNIRERCKIFQASSSEMFGMVCESPQDENTPFNPITLYGVSKLSAHMLVKHYREIHGLFICSGILFNHESPRRKDTFVTQKIIKGLQSGECFTLGNIEARRDWGHAKDYVEAMWLMLQQEHPGDYVVATGKTHSVREFIEIAVHKMGKKIVWSGKGLNSDGRIDGKLIVKVSEEFYRPNDPHSLVGNPSKLESIGWTRNYSLEDVIDDMLST